MQGKRRAESQKHLGSGSPVSAGQFSKYFFLRYLKYKISPRTAAGTPLPWQVMQDERADLLVAWWMNGAEMSFVLTNSYWADRESARIRNSSQLALALLQNHTVVLSKKETPRNVLL